MQKMINTLQDKKAVEPIISFVAQSMKDWNIPVNTTTIKTFIEDIANSLIREFREAGGGNLQESTEVTRNDLEEENFRVDSTHWEIKKLRNGMQIKINPERDITEICEGKYALEQHFSHKAAIRETTKAGKRMPSNGEWRSICTPIQAEIREKKDEYNNTVIEATF
jgi:hypothetical protein